MKEYLNKALRKVSKEDLKKALKEVNERNEKAHWEMMRDTQIALHSANFVCLPRRK